MKRVPVGEISGVFGLQGWVKVRSYTEPRENILRYSPWELEHRGQRWEVTVTAGRRHGPAVVAALAGIVTPEQAHALRGAKISIARSQLPPLPPGEFYWVDLIGLEVFDLNGRSLGRVVELMETGANDVLIVRGSEREILIPWLRDRVIRELDLDAGVMRVDWDPDY
ncbi:ribosome maturation factor RimM [Methylothermus subterraneus]